MRVLYNSPNAASVAIPGTGAGSTTVHLGMLDGAAGLQGAGEAWPIDQEVILAGNLRDPGSIITTRGGVTVTWGLLIYVSETGQNDVVRHDLATGFGLLTKVPVPPAAELVAHVEWDATIVAGSLTLQARTYCIPRLTREANEHGQ